MINISEARMNWIKWNKIKSKIIIKNKNKMRNNFNHMVIFNGIKDLLLLLLLFVLDNLF
jgi:hypothetical protein